MQTLLSSHVTPCKLLRVTSGRHRTPARWQTGPRRPQRQAAAQRAGGCRSLRQAQCTAGKGFGAKPAGSAAAPRRVKRTSPDADIGKWEVNRKLCPCGSKRDYEGCCQRYHDGELEPTAEAVMRARFSAYVKGEIDYILETTHPENVALEGSKRDGKAMSTCRQDVQATHDKVRWLRLKVLGKDSGPGSHEDEAFVAFQTWFKFKDQCGQRQRGTRTETMQERSRFLRDPVTNRWQYVSGENDWEMHQY